jgi:hypothetical protein
LVSYMFSRKEGLTRIQAWGVAALVQIHPAQRAEEAQLVVGLLARVGRRARRPGGIDVGEALGQDLDGVVGLPVLRVGRRDGDPVVLLCILRREQAAQVGRVVV